PLYILYTSGTAGQPKGIVRDNGGHLVALKWSMRHFYGVEPGEVYWAASDIGWVVGHSYMVYGPLLHGASTEFHAIKKVDPEGKHLRRYGLSKFRALFLVGERAHPDTVIWAERLLKV